MDARTRIGIACLSLVLIWIVVYWATPAPSSTPLQPTVTFQEQRGALVPEPRTPVPDRQIEEPVPPPRNSESPIHSEPQISDDPEPALPIPPSQPGRFIPPTFIDYTVREGDNASIVAQRIYGSADHWAIVFLSNPTVDARRLFRVGSVIKLAEDPRNIQGYREGEDRPPIPKMEFIEYRVERNDTLSSISQAIYGRASHWRIIQSANADQVNSEGTNLRPGMILRIPPPPTNDPR